MLSPRSPVVSKLAGLRVYKLPGRSVFSLRFDFCRHTGGCTTFSSTFVCVLEVLLLCGKQGIEGRDAIEPAAKRACADLVHDRLVFSWGPADAFRFTRRRTTGGGYQASCLCHPRVRSKNGPALLGCSRDMGIVEGETLEDTERRLKHWCLSAFTTVAKDDHMAAYPRRGHIPLSSIPSMACLDADVYVPGTAALLTQLVQDAQPFV